MRRARVIKYAAPLLVVLLCSGYLIWIGREMWAVRQQQILLEDLAPLQDSLQKAYESQIHDFRRLQSWAGQWQNKPSLTVDMDSLRRLAQGMDLRVLQMSDVQSSRSGIRLIGSLDLQGTYASCIRFLDTLETLFFPVIQVAGFQLQEGRGGIYRLAALQLSTPEQQASGEKVSKSYWFELESQWLAAEQRDSLQSKLPKTPFASRYQPVKPRQQKKEPTVVEAPPPKLKVLGLVAGRLATVQDDSGHRKMLRVGDSVEQWVVQSIGSSGLVLGQGKRRQNYTAR